MAIKTWEATSINYGDAEMKFNMNEMRLYVKRRYSFLNAEGKEMIQGGGGNSVELSMGWDELPQVVKDALLVINAATVEAINEKEGI